MPFRYRVIGSLENPAPLEVTLAEVTSTLGAPGHEVRLLDLEARARCLLLSAPSEAALDTLEKALCARLPLLSPSSLLSMAAQRSTIEPGVLVLLALAFRGASDRRASRLIRDALGSRSAEVRACAAHAARLLSDDSLVGELEQRSRTEVAPPVQRLLEVAARELRSVAGRADRWEQHCSPDARVVLREEQHQRSALDEALHGQAG